VCTTNCAMSRPDAYPPRVNPGPEKQEKPAGRMTELESEKWEPDLRSCAGGQYQVIEEAGIWFADFV